jgi:hypothetical protein
MMAAATWRVQNKHQPQLRLILYHTLAYYECLPIAHRAVRNVSTRGIEPQPDGTCGGTVDSGNDTTETKDLFWVGAAK